MLPTKLLIDNGVADVAGLLPMCCRSEKKKKKKKGTLPIFQRAMQSSAERGPRQKLYGVHAENAKRVGEAKRKIHLLTLAVTLGDLQGWFPRLLSVFGRLSC